MTIKPIIDVDHNRGSIDWTTVAASGIAAAIIGVTDGHRFVDPLYRFNFTEARASGIPRGSYHFYWPFRNGRTQFDHYMLHRVAPSKLDMFDLERRGVKTRSMVTSDALEFGEAYLQEHGWKMLLYSNYNYFESVLVAWDEILDVFRLHLAWPMDDLNPRPIRHMHKPEIVQYSWTGYVPGVPPPTDLNAYLGTVQEWDQLIGHQTGPTTWKHLTPDQRWEVVRRGFEQSGYINSDGAILV